MALDDGFVRVYRRVLDNPVFRDDGEAMVFVWMIMRAAWRPTMVRYKGGSIELERGQLAVSVRDLGTRFGRSKDWANRFLGRLADRDMIATVVETGVNVVTVCNYDIYQASSDGPATPAARQPRQHRDSTATQNKERKEIKEGILEDEDAGAGEPAVPVVCNSILIFGAWNRMAETSKARGADKLTTKRRTAIRARVADYGEAVVLDAIKAVPSKPWLVGEGERGWCADIDFFLRPDTIAKIREGKYDHGQRPDRPVAEREYRDPLLARRIAAAGHSGMG